MLFKIRKSYVLNFALILALIGGMIPARQVHATIQTAPQTAKEQFPAAKYEPKRGTNPETGKVSFVGGGDPIHVPGVSDAKGMPPQERAMGMANAYGKEFGLKNPSQELKLLKSKKDGNGKDVVRFQQTYMGVPVIAGEMIVNMTGSGELLSISGEVSSDLILDTKSDIKSQEALKNALSEIAKLHNIDVKGLIASDPELWIFDESLLTVSTRPVELVWRMEVTAKDGVQPIREMVLVNAQTGMISWHVNQVDTDEVLPSKETRADVIPTVEKSINLSSEGVVGPGWYVTPSGNDANSCNMPTAPCASIQATINKASAGDTIFVAEGTYTTITASYVIYISNTYYHFSGGWDTTFTNRTGRSIIDGRNSLKGIQILTGDTVPVSVFEHFIIQNCLGGGIYIQASGMTLTDMIIRNNTVTAYGGAAVYVSYGTVVINNSLITNNKNASLATDYSGGAISQRGSLTLNNTTVTNNVSTNSGGGGIYTQANYTLTLNNSTISGNSAAKNGGGLLLEYGATVNINNSTIAYNSAQNGGGIYIQSGSGAYNVRNSIISNNAASVSTADCYASIANPLDILNYNLVGDTTNCNAISDIGNLKSIDPMLDSAITGWPGFHQIPADSPIINHGDPANPGTCLAQDQRGVTRSLPCDIGAIEYIPTGAVAILTVLSGSGQEAVPSRAFNSPLVVRVTDQYYNPIDSVSVTFTAPSSGASNTFTDTASNATSTLTNADGIATSPTLIANATSGSYTVNATVVGISFPVAFFLKNIYPTLSVSSGSPQANQVLTTFGDPLKVLVQYAPDAPIAGIEVTFTAPTSGASGTFADTGSNTTTAVTDVNGIAASSVFTANNIAGSFTVMATIPDPALSVNFQLTNLAAINCSISNGTAAPSLFLPYKLYNCGKTGHGVGVGDFNNDGRKDVALSVSGTLLVFLQDNNGNLSQPRVYSGSSEYLAVGDLNGDYLDDIVTSSGNSIDIFLQRSNGTFAYRVTYPASTGVDAVAVGDVNSDGLKDVAVSHWNSAVIGVFTQNLDSTLNPMVTYPSVAAGYDDIAIGDVNGDGRNDVVKMNGQGYVNANLQVYLQGANGLLGVAIPYSLGCSCLGSGIGVGDVTGDGRADVVMTYGGNQPSAKIAVFAQDLNGSLLTPVSYSSYDIPTPVEIADLNSDNLLDVAILHDGWGRAGVYLQQQGGSLGGESLYTLPNVNSSYDPPDLSIGDVNNDGLPDLLMANYTGLVVLYRNPATPPTSTAVPSPTLTFTPGPGPSPTPKPSSTPGPSPTPVPSSSTGNRRTYTTSGGSTIPGTFLCDQSQLLCTNGADPDADKAHQYAADTFMFYNIHHHRNSFDDQGGTINSTVHYGIGYQNAFWTGSQMVYGDNMAADDVVGHELTHGVTQYASALIYSYQSGAINESFSDVWGEFIDQTNSSGNDSPSVKWLMGEDTPLGAIRSMSNPPAYSNPDKMSSPYYYKGSGDNGGVHTNSGVNNKAAYLMVEGGAFNGRTIIGIGLNKTAAVYYEAQVYHLTMGANYNDLYYALLQACQNLIGGVDGITQNDCDQVKAAAEAVEMVPPVHPTPTPTHTPTVTPMFTPTFTQTASSTPVTNCNQITAGPITISGNSMSMAITNPLTVPIQIQDVFVIWNHDKGHILGSDKTLILNFASLGSQFWSGTSDGPSVTITPAPTTYIPTATSTITFTFHQSYDSFDGSEQIIINLATNGCQSYPIISSSIATNTPTFTPTNTFTPTATPPYSYNPLYLSLTSGQTIGGVSSADEDILRFDGTNWSLFFDGSDVGVSSPDLFAFSLLDPDSILMSFSTAVTVGGLAITPQDIVRFDATSLGSVTAGTFSMYLDGSDVGLDVSGDSIDSMSLLPDGRILISTTGNPVVPGVSGKDEDILAFTPTSLGDVTSGTWTMYFDGSDVGLGDTSNEDVDALDVTSNGYIYLSTLGDFAVNGLAGFDEDVFICVPSSLGDATACNYLPSLYFDGSTWGLSANDVDAFNYLASGPIPTFVAPTNTPTRTPTASFTPSPTNTFTRTPTPAATFTRTLTATNTVGPSLTPTFTATATSTKTATSTAGPSLTPTNTLTFTPTFTATATSAVGPSLTPTNTPVASATNTPSTTLQPLYLSLSSGGTVGGVAAADVDILYFDGTSWSLFFDASDVGILDGTPDQDLNDFYIVDADTILMSFDAPFTLGALSVDPWDILQFDATSLGSNTAGTFSMYFDGSDVGLDDAVNEVLDSMDILPNGSLLLSTNGSFILPGLNGKDEDLLVFTPSTLGENTSGSWTMYFDGSLLGLGDSAEDIDGVNLAPNSDIYLSAADPFAVTGIAGDDEDVFVCTPTLVGGAVNSCVYSPTLYFDGSVWGLAANDVDGLDLP